MRREVHIRRHARLVHVGAMLLLKRGDRCNGQGVHLLRKIRGTDGERCFYGESVNAIYIQIFVTLIANLLLTLLQRRLSHS